MPRRAAAALRCCPGHALDADQDQARGRAALQLVEEHRLLGRRRRGQERREIGDVMGAPGEHARRDHGDEPQHDGPAPEARRAAAHRRVDVTARRGRPRPARSSSPTGRRRRAGRGPRATDRCPETRTDATWPRKPRSRGTSSSDHCSASPATFVSNRRSSAARLPVSVPRIASTSTRPRERHRAARCGCARRGSSSACSLARRASRGAASVSRARTVGRLEREPPRRFQRAVEQLDAARFDAGRLARFDAAEQRGQRVEVEVGASPRRERGRGRTAHRSRGDEAVALTTHRARAPPVRRRSRSRRS